MIPHEFEYTAAATLQETLTLIESGDRKVLAGGMSLIPLMKLRLAAPGEVVDIGRVPGLGGISETDGVVRIGAMTTHHEVESSPVIRAKCPLLGETASHIGDVQVRNMGTIGGSVAHADPAADYPAALQALEAKIVLKGVKSERTVSAEDFFIDTFTTALEPGEIVREVIVPMDGGDTGTNYQKVLQPASGFAIVGIAVRVRKSGGKISMARIGVTGLANKAYREREAEKALEGSAGSPAEIQAVAAWIGKGIDANSDLHASAEYRIHLASVYAAKALTAALGRIA